MVNITSDGTRVHLSMTIGMGDDRPRFSFDAGSILAAKCIARCMREAFETTVRIARRDAYEQGWRDAKAKRAKSKHFSGWLS